VRLVVHALTIEMKLNLYDQITGRPYGAFGLCLICHGYKQFAPMGLSSFLIYI